MKKNNFTRRIIWTLVLGLGVGLGFIFLRETLIGNGNASLWKQINDLLFADILQPANTTAIGIFYIIGQIFMRLLQLVLVPLIFTSIVRSIQQIQETRVLNKLAKKGFGNFMQLLAIAIVLASVTGFTAYKLGVFQIANLGAIEITEGVVESDQPIIDVA
ncbi:cation:dicarboxylate symporter family transporter [Erysipelothrix piscisicarius]|uniref:cation:dicarboxylate symporter family transporter n=1 Tax=Erysipelothrix piscisicarius TaxID=2485784 RepID=UPI002F937162